MNENNTQQGIGLVAVIAIVAVIGIGGVAAAQMYSSNQAAVAVDEAEMQSEAEQAVAAVKADIKSSLLSLRTEVQGDLSTNVSAALTLIDGLRADVAAISAEGNAELQAELNQMDASLAELETQLESESAEAVTTMTNIIDEVDVAGSFDAGMQTTNEEDGMQSSDTTDEEGAEMEESETSSEAEINVNAEADSSVESDMIEVEGESEMELSM
jgi:hypothetical protein